LNKVIERWRTPEATEYRKLYQTKQWQQLRRRVLLRDGYRCQHKQCGALLKRGRTDARSAVVHHIIAHKGDLDLFFDYNNLVSTCWKCHSGDIQSIEARGYDTQIGENGWPIDPKHRGLMHG
jgi:5-methylcytosine-specific restriction endonuclease McrA